jgi:hypothetical protein
MPEYKVQSILFNKDKNTLEEAVSFLKKHNYKNKGYDEKEDTYRFRQYNPSYLKRLDFTEYRTITIDKKKGIKFIIVYKSGSDMTPTIQERPEIVGGFIMRKSQYL